MLASVSLLSDFLGAPRQQEPVSGGSPRSPRHASRLWIQQEWLWVSFSQQGAYWPENALLPILDAGPRTWKAALIRPVPKCSPASHMCIQKFRKVRERSGTYALEFPDTIIFLTIGHRLSLKKNKWRTILESQVIQSQLLTSDKLNVLVLQMEFGTINTAKWVR